MQIWDLFGTIRIQGMENISNQLNTVGDRIGKIGSKLTGFGTRLTAGITVPLVGVIGKSIMLASDLGEAMNVVDVTFGDNAQKTKDWAKTLNSQFGIVELEAIQYSGRMGAMLKSSGLSSDAAQGMAQSLVELTGDMSSFYNLSHEEMWEKIRSGISGETEPLKALGINMSVANLEAYALSEGIKKPWKEMTQGEQTQLRYNYLMKQTADAQGDFNRTSDSFANQLKIVQGNLTDVGTKLGTILLPYALKAVEAISKLVTWFQNLSPSGQKVALIIGIVAAILPPLILGIGMLVSAVGGIITAFGAVSGALASISVPIVLVVAGIVGLIAVFIRLWQTNEQFRNGVITAFNAVKSAVIMAFERIKAVVIPVFNTIKDTILNTIDNLDFTPVQQAFEGVKQAVIALLPYIQAVGAVLGGVLAVAIGIVVGAINGLISIIPNLIAIFMSVVGVVYSVFSLIVGIITGNTEQIKASFAALWTNVKNIFINAFNAIVGFVKGFVTGITNFFKSLYNTLVGHSIIPDMVNGIINWFKQLPGKVLALIQQLVSQAISKFNSFKSKVTSVISGIVNAIVNKFNEIKSRVVSAISSFVSSAVSKFNSFKSKVVSIIGTLVSSITSKFSGVIGVLDKVAGGFNKVRDAVKGAIDKVKNFKLPSLKIPGFATGVQNFGGGWAVVGEQGAELVQLPKGSNVYSNSASKSLLNSSGSRLNQTGNDTFVMNGNVVIDSKNIKDINDVINLFKTIKREKVARGGVA